MSVNLVVDIGNTFLKAAVFEEGELQDSIRYRITAKEHDAPPYKPIKNLASSYNIEYALLTSVQQNTGPIEEQLSSDYSVIILNERTPLPIENNYETPESLGNDRLALAVGANSFFPGQNTLVIDTGTCVTFDFINQNNQYLGGSISPGLKMRLHSLHNFTDQLPLLDINKVKRYSQTLSDEAKNYVAKTTEDSIIVGVYHGLLEEINGFMKRYNYHYKNLRTVITGGDAELIAPQLSEKTYKIPNLLLYGLNKIIDYNVHQAVVSEK